MTHPNQKIFLDRFLENAIELDVDALCDGREVWIGGIMQHVEEAGVHSGDSACVLPPHSLGGEMLDQIRAATRELALAIGVVGLLNVQYAVVDGQLYVLEANPRASRTVPFVSKAVGLPLAKLACRVMLGEPLSALHLPREREGLGFGDHVSVKEAVLPFDRFEGSDAVLGPEMRSTGEVMGIARDFPTAFAKAQAAAGCPLPLHGTVFISVTDADKAGAFAIAERLHENGFRILATRGTAEAIARMGIPAQALNKVSEGSPHVLDWIERGDVDLVVNTPTGSGARTDGWQIRRAAVTRGVPCLTTLAAGVSAARAISSARQSGPPPVLCLQELHRGRETAGADVGRRGGEEAEDAAPAGDSPATDAHGEHAAVPAPGDSPDHAVAGRYPPGPEWRDAVRHAVQPRAAAAGARTSPSAGGRHTARGVPDSRLRTPAAAAARLLRPGAPCRGARSHLPQPARGCGRAGQGRQLLRRSRPARLRLRRGRHRHGSPAAGQPTAPRLPGATRRRVAQPDGLSQPGCVRGHRAPASRSGRVVVGANVGKSMVVPLQRAAGDYCAGVCALAPVCDYLVVNVSSPNTPGLKEMQTVELLRPLLLEIQRVLKEMEVEVPLLVKVGPDLADRQLLAIADLALELGLDGIVAVNTSADRTLLTDPSALAGVEGGEISGPPLRARAVEVLRLLHGRVGDRLVLISVGGISTPEDAWERILAGATLLQAYTGFVYAGPVWPSHVNRALARRVRAVGAGSIQQLVGSRHATV